MADLTRKAASDVAADLSAGMAADEARHAMAGMVADEARHAVAGPWLAGAVAAGLAACTDPAPPTDTPTSTPAGHPNWPRSRAQAARFLQHAQLASTDADIDALLRGGPMRWLQAQFSLPHDDRSWDWLEARGYARIDEHAYYATGATYFELAAYRQCFQAPDGLRRRIQLALTEFFVVSLLGFALPWSHFVYATYWDLLGDHAFGNFRTLLEQVSLSVAMGASLSTAGNEKEDAVTGRLPDENFARELMQLFTIGPVALHPDGSPQLDGQGRPIETYGADDVRQLARVFTGYFIDDSGPGFDVPIFNRRSPVHGYARRAMAFDPARHAPQAAQFLGTTVPAGTPGPQALRMALDTLFRHPNVGPFFGRQLIQRLVTSQPSAAYVARVAAAFNNNGHGVRGDLRAVITAVLLDAEALDEAGLQSPSFGKLREPALRFLQWGRSFGLRSRAGSWKFLFPEGDPTSDFGQHLFWSPSVFNFFRPGFVPPGTPLAATRSTAPEFQIVNEATVAQYINCLEAMVLDGPWVFAPERPDTDRDVPSAQTGWGDMAPDYRREMALAHDTAALVDRLNLLLCAGQLDAQTRARLVQALDTTPVHATSDDPTRRLRVARAVLLVMVCPQYLVQR